jgi:hypothetical protein
MSLDSSRATGTVVALQLEPISPELVLIDPELARRERAKLEERAQLRAIHEAEDLRRAVERTLDVDQVQEPVIQQSRAMVLGRRALAATLFCSLIVNGFFAAKLVARSHDVATTAAALVPPSLVTTIMDQGSRRQSPTNNVKRPLTPAVQLKARQPSKAAVEMKLLSVMLSAPAKRLPKAFVDPTTHLLRNNVQVSCRLSTKRAFLCAIRPPATARSKAALLVRYRVLKNGKGVFHWFR